MKVTNTLRSQIMRIAHAINNKLVCGLAEALKRAWALTKMAFRMRTKKVRLVFKKADGTIGVNWATLKGFEGKITDLNVFRFIDVHTNSVKCFKIENFMYYANH